MTDIESRSSGGSRRIGGPGAHVMIGQLYGRLQFANWEPLAAGVLASALERYAQPCVAYPRPLIPSVSPRAVEDFVEEALALGVDVIGLSVQQSTLTTAERVLTELERRTDSATRPVTVLGGSIPTNAPEFFLDRYPWAIIVRGWGEDALVEIVRRVTAGTARSRNWLAGIPSLAFRDGDEIATAPVPPAPALAPVAPKRVEPGRYFNCVETSRGCHYGRCTFCVRPPGKKNFWERIPLDEILGSIAELRAAGAPYFAFVDEDFVGNDLAGALKIAHGVEEIGGMTFSFSIRADNIHNPKETAQDNERRRQVMRTLRRAGLARTYIGLESVSNSQLKRYGKGIRPVHQLRAISVVLAEGIVPEIGYIMFDPFVTLDELRQAAHTIARTGIWEYMDFLFQEMRVYRNTALERWLDHKGMLGTFNFDLLEYEYSYENPEVETVARLCKEWSGPFRQVHRSVRNLDRTEIAGIGREYRLGFQKLDLRALGTATTPLQDQDAAFAELERARLALCADLHRTLTPIATTDSELAILDELERFIAGDPAPDPNAVQIGVA